MIMTDKEQGVHLREGRTHTYPQYMHFATYYGIRLDFFGSNGHQVTNYLKILVLTFFSISTFMIMTDREQVVLVLEGRTHTYPQYRHFAIYYGIRLTFLDSNGHQ